jgi:hypothetical protein
MRRWGHKNGLPCGVRGADYRPSFPAIMMRRAFFWLLVLAAPVGAADADIVWEPAQILDAEQIAESGAFVPLAIPTFFDNFRYPFLQDDESVVFIANDGGAAGLGREGIFRIAKNGEVSKLAEVGDYFSGTGLRLTGVSGLRVDGGRALFRCGADDGSGGVGMWEDGSLLLLAQTGEASGLGDIGYPGFAGNTVTFYAEDEGKGGAIYAVDLAAFPRVPQKLVDTKTTIPGSDGKLFGSFGFQQEAEDGVSVFRGFASGARELLQKTGGSEEALGGVFRQNIRGEAEPEKILDTLAPLPGGPPGATFAELQNAIPRDGTVLVPSWRRDHSGFYYIGRDGEPRLVADTNTRIPELFDGNFTRFDKWAANCAPWVIFIAEAGSYRGLFAMHMERNELFLLLDNRTVLGGKTVGDVELSSRPKLGDNMVMAIEFTDGSSGVYLLKFGDGWGKGIFRRDAAISEKARAMDTSMAGEEAVSSESDFSDEVTSEVSAPSAAPLAVELVEEGAFRMVGNSRAYDAPDAATGKTNKVDETELIQSGSVFAANKGLNFGFRYVLHSPGEDRCGVEGFEMFIVHPPIKGPDGQERTTSKVPFKLCFNDGKAEDFLIYSLEEDYEVLPGSWTMQVRKDGEVLLSRAFTLL